MSSHSPLDAGIPVLTEILAGPPETQAPPEIAVIPAAPQPIDAGRALPAATEDTRWTLLEQQIRDSVLRQLMERIDFVMEQRVRDSLADVLQTAIDHLACEIKSGLEVSIREVVTRAVTQEITKLRSAGK